MTERTFEVGDKVSFTMVSSRRGSMNFTVKEGKVTEVGTAAASVKVRGKFFMVRLSELRHANERNTLTEALRGEKE